MIRRAHPSSLASIAGEPRRDFAEALAEAGASFVARDVLVGGRHTKIRRRLGVSPGPVGLKGPVTVNVSRCGCPIVSSVSLELRMKGCRRSGLIASVLS